MEKIARFSVLLAKKYTEEGLSTDESEEFSTLLTELPEEELSKAIDDIIEVDMAAPFDKEAVLSHILSATLAEKVISGSPAAKLLKYVAVAACVLFVLSIGIYRIYIRDVPDRQTSTPLVHRGVETDVVLPDDYVTIKTDDGQIVSMSDSVDSWADAGFGVRRIGKEGYALDIRTGDTAKIAFNSFSTPKGVSSQVTLPDGTKVWLNSGSTIKVSSQYNQKERIIEMEGEAFFDVKHDASKPFVAITGQTRITVLGTQFNILALPDNAVVKTTLSRGSVRVNQLGKQLKLLPGEQAITRKDKATIDKQLVDLDQVLAWKDGYFRITAQPIEIVMNELLRWYDIDEIVWKNTSDARFTISVARSRSLKEVLKKIELVSDMHFEIKERRIIVK